MVAVFNHDYILQQQNPEEKEDLIQRQQEVVEAKDAIIRAKDDTILQLQKELKVQNEVLSTYLAKFGEMN